MKFFVFANFFIFGSFISFFLSINIKISIILDMTKTFYIEKKAISIDNITTIKMIKDIL